MPNVTVDDLNAWSEKTKLHITAVESALEEQQTSAVMARLSSAYDVSAWTSPDSTPSLVRKAIAMYYMGWYYMRTFSEDEGVSSYGEKLILDADVLIEGIAQGSVALLDAKPEDLLNAGSGLPIFEILDEPKFSMSRDW